MKFKSKIDNEVIIMTEPKETKAVKMKSVYIMANTTHEALKRDEKITSAKMLNYKKVQDFIQKNRKDIIKNGVRFQINVLTEEGWRSKKNGYFGINEELKFYDAVQHYDDERAQVDEIYMIQILRL